MTVLEIRIFLGMAGYYRRFVKNFSQISKPLTQLTKKDVSFVWTSKCEESFHELRHRLTTALVLALPSGSGGYRGHVIAYDSRKLKTHEDNYPVHGLDLAAIVFALKIWHHYFYGERFEIFADHKSLKYWFTQAELNMMQQIWMDLLKDYDCEIKYIQALLIQLQILLAARNCNAIWVVVDRLSKSAHFLPYNWDFNFDRMSRLYVQEVVPLHGIPLSIVSDQDPSYHRSIGMAPFKALYGHHCRTPLFWDEFGERQVEGPQMIQQMTDVVELIRRRIKVAQERHESYANTHRRPLHFEVGVHVFLRVSPFRKVMIFGLNVKLSLRFIRPFEILEKVGDVAYHLDLPPYILGIHDVFHVSLQRQYVADKSYILHPTEVQLDQDLYYVERPLRILDRKDKKNHIYTSGASCTNIAVIRGALRAKKPELLTVILPQNLKKQPPESQELLNLHFLCPLDNSDHFVDSPYISVQTMENQIKELERQGSSVASEVELERLKYERQRSAEMIRKYVSIIVLCLPTQMFQVHHYLESLYLIFGGHGGTF
ncbi:uncharacterized protein [Henckelia pumila]|uniref:uncharacterized protein n=1 Tax=Henckelia pumila TaxID=405737 RepID=UPI003C6E21BC